MRDDLGIYTTYVYVHHFIVIMWSFSYETIIFNLDDVLVAKDELETGVLLGKGSFGTVYKGLYLGTEVAIKTILMPDDESRKECINEARILKLESLLIQSLLI